MLKNVFPWITFLTIVIATVVVSHLYIGVRLAQTLPRTSDWKYLLWVLIVCMAGSVIAAPMLVRFLGVSEIQGSQFRILPAIAFCGFILLGFMVVCVSSFLLFDLIKLACFGFEKILNAFAHTNEPLMDPARRQFLVSLAPWAAFGAAGLLSAKGFKTAFAGPEIVHIEVPSARLPEALNGFRIVQISDLHIGNLIRRPYVEDVVEKTLKLNPDIIVLTGDMVDGTPTSLQDDLTPLKLLKAKYGVFFITGNHEYYSGCKPWLEFFSSCGFEVLTNANRIIEISGKSGEKSRLGILGIPDPTSARFSEEEPDILKAAEGTENCDYSILLAHQPGAYREAEKIKCDLQLSGHTHSGQFYPVGFVIGAFHRYYGGLNRHKDQFWVYVNRGTGFWGPPNRLGLPSEITALQLTNLKS